MTMPYWFKCGVQRRGGRMHDPHTVVRTGRTKPNPSRRQSMRTLDVAVEYKCSCGHIGWTTNRGVMDKPLEGLDG